MEISPGNFTYHEFYTFRDKHKRISIKSIFTNWIGHDWIFKKNFHPSVGFYTDQGQEHIVLYTKTL